MFGNAEIRTTNTNTDFNCVWNRTEAGNEALNRINEKKNESDISISLVKARACRNGGHNRDSPGDRRMERRYLANRIEVRTVMHRSRDEVKIRL